MDALLIAIVTWLSANFGLPPDYNLPNIAYLPGDEISEIRYSGVAAERDLAHRRRPEKGRGALR